MQAEGGVLRHSLEGALQMRRVRLNRPRRADLPLPCARIPPVRRARRRTRRAAGGAAIFPDLMLTQNKTKPSSKYFCAGRGATGRARDVEQQALRLPARGQEQVRGGAGFLRPAPPSALSPPRGWGGRGGGEARGEAGYLRGDGRVVDEARAEHACRLLRREHLQVAAHARLQAPAARRGSSAAARQWGGPWVLDLVATPLSVPVEGWGDSHVRLQQATRSGHRWRRWAVGCGARTAFWP